MAFDLDSIVEVAFQAVFERNNGASLGRLCDDSNLEQAFVYKFVVISRVFLAGMEQVHLECEQWEFQLASDECKSLRRVLLTQLSC